jgi:hypothetical protein
MCSDRRPYPGFKFIGIFDSAFAGRVLRSDINDKNAFFKALFQNVFSIAFERGKIDMCVRIEIL